MDEANTALAKQAPEFGRNSRATGHPADLEVKQPVPSAEQLYVGDGWNDVVRREVSSSPPILPQNQNTFPSRSGWRISCLK